MKKEIKDYLHLYFGAKVRFRYIDYNTGTWTIWETLIGKVYDKIVNDFSIDGIQLELRRLDSMTEDEMVELIMCATPDGMEDAPTKDDFNITMIYNDGGNMVDENVAIGADINCRCWFGQTIIKKCGTIETYTEDGDVDKQANLPKQYAYLLSKHFDLFGLIESGLAIEKK